MKQILLPILLVSLISIGLSIFANISYIYTLLAISAWAFIGHLITIDDDMLGGFSNIEKSNNIWKRSKIELIIKLVILIVLVILLVAFPSINNFGK